MQIAFVTKSIVEEHFGGQTFLGQQLLLIKGRAAHRENSRQEQEAAMVTHPAPSRFIAPAASNTGTHYSGASLLCHCLPEVMAENESHIGACDK